MFEPLNEAHAISEAAFYFEFSNIPDSSLKLLLANHSKVEELLPKVEPLPIMIVEQSGSGFRMNQLHGAEWKHFKPNGEADWLARITPDAVSVHCLEYTRWEDVWSTASSILARIFSGVENHHLQAESVGLRIVDQFKFSGSISEYSALDLIRSDNRHISQKVLISGTRWHNYTGWFEHSAELEREVLQQLNIDAVERPDMRTPVVSITHSSLLRESDPSKLEKFTQLNDIAHSDFAKFMSVAHGNNRDVLLDILTDSILKRINLKGRS